MNPRRAVFLTARREVREKINSRAWRVSTVVQVLLVIGISVVALATSDSGPDKLKLGVAGAEAGQIADAARQGQKAFDLEVSPRNFSSPAAARAAVADGNVDMAVVGRSLVTGADPDEQQVALVQSAAGRLATVERLREAGVSAERIQQALDPPPLATQEVGSSQAGQGLAFAGQLLLYIALLTFGYTVASGVVEEKTSRVIELILSSIKPVHLLAGKVIGIGLTGLAQLLIVTGAGLAVALGTGEVELPSSTGATAAAVVVYFILGYLFYACAFAVAGSIVSRQEDTQSTTTPMMVVLVAGYLASTSVIDNAQSSLAKVLTYLPPIAPMVVPARVAQDAIEWWEVAISIVLMVLGTLFLIRLAARIYERSILRMGAPLKLSQALRLAR